MTVVAMIAVVGELPVEADWLEVVGAVVVGAVVAVAVVAEFE